MLKKNNLAQPPDRPRQRGVRAHPAHGLEYEVSVCGLAVAQEALRVRATRRSGADSQLGQGRGILLCILFRQVLRDALLNIYYLIFRKILKFSRLSYPSSFFATPA